MLKEVFRICSINTPIVDHGLPTHYIASSFRPYLFKLFGIDKIHLYWSILFITLVIFTLRLMHYYQIMPPFIASPYIQVNHELASLYITSSFKPYTITLTVCFISSICSFLTRLVFRFPIVIGLHCLIQITLTSIFDYDGLTFG